MRTILVASTKPYIGKSGIAVALTGMLADRGLDVGYFKPYGTMPVIIDDVSRLVSDEDALYVNRLLRHPCDPAEVCPVVRTQSLIDQVLSGTVSDCVERVRIAFERCSRGRDVMVIEGPREPTQGASVGLSLFTMIELFEGPVLLLDRPRPTDLPDDAVCLARDLGARLGGLLLNGIDESRMTVVREKVVPFFEARGIPVLGVLPFDPELGSVTVGEIAEALGAVVLTARDHLDDTVEGFMVGAMGQEKALRYFRRLANKAVITGGDRADVQLAALVTSTRCIVLTGGMAPDPFVQARAEELQVPMLMVDFDTLTAVECIETLLGRVHLHDAVKAQRIREMLEREADVTSLFRAAGVE
ncbi:MAG: DRTGG domain-containing protein [Coriobacteriia bacterium]